MKLHSALTIALALFSGSQAYAANLAFLVIPNVPGDSTNEQYVRAIEASSVSVGIVNRLCTGFTVVKALDSASAPLAGAAAAGTIYPLVTVYLVKAGAVQQNFATYSLQNSAVTSIATAATGTVFSETVTLSPATIAVTYRQQSPDGSLGGAVTYTLTCSKAR